MISDDLRASYDAVLSHIRKERSDVHQQVATLQRQLKELDQTATGILRLLGQSGTEQQSAQIPLYSPSQGPQRYATASTRWAILLELNNSTAPMSVQDIADALLAGGIRTRATNFNNNVSAVLSDMKTNKIEVDVQDGKWVLTDVGKSAAAYISNKLRKRPVRSERTEMPEI